MKTSAKSSGSNQNNPFGELNLRLNPENAPPSEDEPLRTLIVGNLEDRIGEELLFELFMQAGPLSGIRLPRDKVTHRPTGMAFVVFRHPVSVDFAIRLMQGIRLYGRELVLTKMGINVPPQSSHNLAPPDHSTHGGSADRRYQDHREHFMYQQPSPRPLLMPPPPPLFPMAKPPFANYSPMPYFRPSTFAPNSDPGYSHSGGDFRRSHIDHAGFSERSRQEFSSHHHQPHQGSRNDTPTRRPVPYARPAAHSRDWH